MEFYLYFFQFVLAWNPGLWLFTSAPYIPPVQGTVCACPISLPGAN